MVMSKKEFLAFYRAALLEAYPWARVAETTGKLDLFLKTAKDTIEGRSNAWTPDGPCLKTAWQKLGFRGVPSLRNLRDLP